MGSRSRARPLPKRRLTKNEMVDIFVARLFGYEDGPLFDRGAMSPVRLDEFTQSEAVRAATWRFVSEMDERWKAAYPGKPPLLPALRTRAPTVVPLALPELSASESRHATSAESPMTHASPNDPNDAPPVGSIPAAGAAAAAAPPAVAPPAERKATFNVPNARCGEPYRAPIAVRTEQGSVLRATSARVPAESGLSFDADSGELHGVAGQAGDHPIAIQWQDESGATRSGSFVLIVNANPRDLWKNIDADPNDPYFKPNQASELIEAPPLRIAAASKRGRSHAHAGTFRDDDFLVVHDAASGWSVLLVADGAGSARSSRKGAALTAERAGGHLAAELAGDEGGLLDRAVADWHADASTGARPLKDRLYNLFGKAAWAALRAIEDEADARSAPIKDYSTTLLCAVHRKTPAGGHFVASFWIGDGAICAYGGAGRATLMGKPDSGEFAGQTRFLDRAALSDSVALWERIQFGHHDALTALLLMTDGISDPRFETDNSLGDAARWDALWTELAPMLAAPEPDKALVDWMDFFVPGHHDDRTIALLW